MSKKIMKRSLALGALMAFVITGSAWAEEVDTRVKYNGVQTEVITVDSNGAVFDNVKFNSTPTDMGSSTTSAAIMHTSGSCLFIKDGIYQNIEKHIDKSYASVLYSTGGFLSIDGASFIGNINWYEVRGGKFNLVQDITGNAVISISSSATSIKNSKFDNNISGHKGGAINYSNGTLEIEDSIFNNNKTKHDKGGAISINDAILNLEGNTFNGNISEIEWGGAINIEGDGGSEIESTINLTGNNTFESNIAALGGGAVGSKYGYELNIGTDQDANIKTVFKNNNAKQGKGGAIYNTGFANDNKDDKIDNIDNLPVLNFNNGIVEFDGNSAAGEGGAIYSSENTTVNVNGGEVWFKNNDTESDGGAIYNEGNLNFNEASTTYFEKNIAVKNGGAIHNDGNLHSLSVKINGTNYTAYIETTPTVNFNGGTVAFIGNEAKQNGGAIYNELGDEKKLNNGTTVKTQTQINFGKGFITFKDNKAWIAGGAIYNASSMCFNDGVVATFKGNTAGGLANDIYNVGSLNINSGAKVEFDGGITGDGVITIAKSNGDVVDGKLSIVARESDVAKGINSAIYVENSVQNNGYININKNVIATFTNFIKGSGSVNVDGGTLVGTFVEDNGTCNNLDLKNGASYDFSGNADSAINKLSMTKDSIIKHNSTPNIIVTNYSGDGTVAFNSDGHLHIDSGSGKLNLTADNLTVDKFNDVAGKLGVKEEAKGIEAKMIIAEDDIVGETIGVVTYAEDEVNGYYHGLVAKENITEKANTKNQAISDAAIGMKLHWRAHVNDMNKRMGELRDANGEHGVWARMVRGESEYKNTKAQYNQYQLGYDEKLSVDKRWTVGAAVTFSEGDASYGYGSTEDKSTAFAIYGSKLNNDGTFVDLIARYAHLESDVEDQSGKGDYSTNGMSVSAEFGKRIQQGNGLWIEPQFELTYGNIDSAEFQIGGKTVQVGDMDSLIGRVGFRIGKDIEKGNVYARASYLYDFDGETETSFTNGTATRYFKDDLGGGWWEVGVGANINLSKATYVYADVEKTFGGEVDTNWQWNLGVRYSF